jgi:glutamate carboxypeptidase
MPIALVSVGDEEIGSPGSRELLESLGRGCKGALVFEAGRAEDRIITRRKGTGGLTVTVRGRAAHAGNNHADGINAIAAVAQLVTRLVALTDYDRGITVNVGMIGGGDARNTVPAHASCEVDLRFLRVEDGHALVSDIDRAARAVAADTGAEFTLKGGVRRPPLERTDASAELCRLYGECAKTQGLGHDEADLIGGGSDASTLGALGVPSIDGLGPRGRGFHTHDEFIEWPTVVPRIKALVATLTALCPPV